MKSLETKGALDKPAQGTFDKLNEIAKELRSSLKE
jgi:hypothetical protein